MRDMDREFRQLEKSFGYPSFLSATRPWRPFIDEHPTEVEVYRVKNPIVEEDGVKKFKLEFDVRRFKPEDVKIKTNAKDRILQIEAKTADENSKFEYFRKVSIPEGVQPTELTCKFKGDGVLEFEAPYTEPAKVELPKDTILEIKHE
uniref:SHSP domain-containing protein n=1 Tax=Acrobeloides nanus TaxID=290746 RepID=A0A914D294_9BILA